MHLYMACLPASPCVVLWYCFGCVVLLHWFVALFWCGIEVCCVNVWSCCGVCGDVLLWPLDVVSGAVSVVVLVVAIVVVFEKRGLVCSVFHTECF